MGSAKRKEPKKGPERTEKLGENLGSVTSNRQRRETFEEEMTNCVKRCPEIMED